MQDHQLEDELCILVARKLNKADNKLKEPLGNKIF